MHIIETSMPVISSIKSSNETKKNKTQYCQKYENDIKRILLRQHIDEIEKITKKNCKTYDELISHIQSKNFTGLFLSRIIKLRSIIIVKQKFNDFDIEYETMTYD